MTAVSPSSLGELIAVHRGSEPWLIQLVQGDVDGGKTSSKELDSIAGRPDATALVVSGLDQTAFETLVHRYGSQFLGIHFWKCPRIEDLSPLEDLPKLRYVGFYWNQRADRLWDLSRTPDLRGLEFDDFTRIRDLEDVRRGESLEELRFGDKVWPGLVIESLSPLESLPQLTSLDFDAKRIQDERVEPIASLTRLEFLRFLTRQFTTRQVAWLRAHLPDSLQSDSLQPVWRPERPFGDGEFPKDTLVVGKRKPWLNSVRDAGRIRRYVGDFERMVEEFRRNPDLPPD